MARRVSRNTQIKALLEMEWKAPEVAPEKNPPEPEPKPEEGREGDEPS